MRGRWSAILIQKGYRAVKFIKPRKAFLSTVVVLLLSLLGACGPVLSIHPLYTDKDVVFDPALLGTWIDPTDKAGSPLIFERAGNNSYKASMRLSDQARVDGIFEVHLVKLQGQVFLDAVQTRNRISGQEVDLGIAVPGHVLARVSIEGNALRLNFLDQEWIKKELKSGKISIPHEEVDQAVVLTASTSELQKFALEHEEQAFPASNSSEVTVFQLESTDWRENANLSTLVEVRGETT